MQTEQDPALVMNAAKAPQRRWQFSIRSLLGLMLGASVLLAFISWWGTFGAALFALITSPVLIVKGLVQRQLDHFVVGLLLFLVGLIPTIAPIIVGGCALLTIISLLDQLLRSNTSQKQ